ncbi:MAG: hypothetical protein QM736_02955 [Vicinamibacterales bacterium]
MRTQTPPAASTSPKCPRAQVDVRVFQPGSSSTVLEIASGQVTAADDAGTVPIAIAAKSYSVTVTGKIFENDGVNGLPSVSLRLLRAIDNTVIANTCTCFNNPADGTFTFPAVTSTGAGIILEAFSPADSTSYRQPLVPTANGTLTTSMSLPVYSITLQGHVYAADGVTPVPGGVVFPYTFTNRGGLGTTVQPNGFYSIGRYRLSD